jgi:hypothetical protein
VRTRFEHGLFDDTAITPATVDGLRSRTPDGPSTASFADRRGALVKLPTGQAIWFS